MPSPPSGCVRHLLIIGVLLAVAAAVLLARHPDRARRVWDDGQAMREGAEEAQAMRSPEDLMTWVAAHPEHASLIVMTADGDVLLNYEADRERPVPGLPALWLAAEWANRARAGRLALSLASPAVLDARRLAGRAASPDSASVRPDTLLGRALRGDRVAESALLHRLGPERVARQAAAYGADPPIAFEGLVLAWAAGDSTGTSAPALARRFAADSAFRADARARFSSGADALALREQRAFASASLPRGTARGYARFFADALADSTAPFLSSRPPAALRPPLSSTVLTCGSRLLPPRAGRDDIAAAGPTGCIGAKGGGVTGHLAYAAWSQQETVSHDRAAVLLLSDLPIALFYHLSQTGLDAALALDLVMTDTLAGPG